MTLTTTEAGIYVVSFSASMSHTSAPAVTSFTLYSGGVAIGYTERGLNVARASGELGVDINTVLVLANGAVVDVRWRTTTSAASSDARVMYMLKLSD